MKDCNPHIAAVSAADLAKREREVVNTLSDADLAADMYDSWMHKEIASTPVNDLLMERMKKRIDGKLRHEKKLSLQQTLLRVAAVLLPIFVLFTAYMLYQQKSYVGDLMVYTGYGQHSNMMLPDGTQVSLNSHSRISYNQATYNRKKREVCFEGEAYFQVVKNREVPFVIDADRLQVTVLGTVFNLCIRNDAKTAELALESGSVRLYSTLTAETVMLAPSQKAVLERSSGHIRVIDENDVTTSSAWREGKLIFHQTSLTDVIEALEDNCGITIQVADTTHLGEKFTGTLPVYNLLETEEILERSFLIPFTFSRGR
jgi:ferric-dicitrate binding protein FerR (iron transport regulator)